MALHALAHPPLSSSLAHPHAGLFLLAADFVVRSYYAAKGAHISGIKRSKDGRVAEVTVTLEPGTFKDPAKLAGAHIFLKVPAVSRLD